MAESFLRHMYDPFDGGGIRTEIWEIRIWMKYKKQKTAVVKYRTTRLSPGDLISSTHQRHGVRLRNPQHYLFHFVKSTASQLAISTPVLLFSGFATTTREILRIK